MSKKNENKTVDVNIKKQIETIGYEEDSGAEGVFWRVYIDRGSIRHDIGVRFYKKKEALEFTKLIALFLLFKGYFKA